MESTKSVRIRFPYHVSNCREIAIENRNLDCLKTEVASCYGLREEDFYLTQNGRILKRDMVVTHQPVDVMLRLLGGKGGFGSMLRAIGAQIEKTTNRDACRDLSGRRLRDINEEQRLKRWFAKQAEREQEKEEQRKKKLEKLRQFNEGPPLPILDDPEYNRQRAEMVDAVYEAVDKGFEASKRSTSTVTSASSDDSESSSVPENEEGSKSEEVSKEIIVASSASTSITSSKPTEAKQPKKKIKKLMMDEDFSTDSSSDESDSEPVAKKAKVN